MFQTAWVLVGRQRVLNAQSTVSLASGTKRNSSHHHAWYQSNSFHSSTDISQSLFWRGFGEEDVESLWKAEISRLEALAAGKAVIAML